MRSTKPKPCAGQKQSGGSKSRNSLRKSRPLSAATLTLLLMLNGCASSLKVSPPVVVQPSSSAITEPADASGFYQRLTNWRESVKAFLETETQDLTQ